MSLYLFVGESMTKEKMIEAARIMNLQGISDEQLDLAIEAMELVLAFYHERGLYFGIISSAVRQELEVYRGFKWARSLNRSKKCQNG